MQNEEGRVFGSNRNEIPNLNEQGIDRLIRSLSSERGSRYIYLILDILTFRQEPTFMRSFFNSNIGPSGNFRRYIFVQPGHNFSENTDFRNPPMQEEQIHSIPEFKFTQTGEHTEKKNCVICMEDFESQENVKLLACGHLFHSDCVNKWLLEKSTCPMCNTSINS
jgi:hypothetical protein